MTPFEALRELAPARPESARAPADDPAVVVVDGRGMICNCNRASEALFGYRRAELIWRHLSLLLPELADVELARGGTVNPHLRFRARFRQFEAVTRGGGRFSSNLFFAGPDESGQGRWRLIVRRDGQMAANA